MARVAAAPTADFVTTPTVRACYDLLTAMPLCGLADLTDGKYVDDRFDRAAYLEAQDRQAEYLLDRARCGRGTRLLDIGCGYGRILQHAARRGAQAVGITISPPQVEYCRKRGLTVHELNYRHILDDVGWEHSFDAIVANGSLEHFVQAGDAASGRADDIYREMFKICHRLLLSGGRLVTTAIHFREPGQFEPAAIVCGPSAHPHGSPEYHFAMLVKRFGGWYPEPDQLQRCADGFFELVEQEDGTHDYYLTSEYWLRRSKCMLATSPRVWWAVVRLWWQQPGPAREMLRLLVWDQSWAWQFREPAPMRLLRQTWLAK